MTFEPETALVKCSTSHGDVAMELYREWSPNGFDRAVSLYEQGFYNHSHFYRVIPGFLVQFGIR
jgi:peptidyl-prolyl cis-trans isomerase A (cyclophilin A)